MAKKKKKTPTIIDIVSQVDTNDAELEGVDIKSNLVELPFAEGKFKRKKTGRSQGKGSKKAVARKVARPKQEIFSGDDMSLPGGINLPDEIGVLALRNIVVFPGTVIPLAVGRPRSRRLINEITGSSRRSAASEQVSQSDDKILGVITQKDPENNKPGFKDLHSVGTIVTVLKKFKLPDGNNSLVVHGLVRFRVVRWLSVEPFLKARIEVIESKVRSGKNLQALINNVRNMAHRMVELSPNIPEEVQVILESIEDPGALADFLAANINTSVTQKQELLQTIDVTERLNKLSLALAHQLELLELGAKLQNKVNQSIDKTQREYYLQEQLKAIQKELGQSDHKSSEMGELKKCIEAAKMPEKVHAEAMRELDRLDKIHTMSPEYSVLRNYLDWLCELPWSKSTRDKHNLNSARRILNADHYDLVKVKKRILEFLAVKKLNPSGRSPILCFVGPPGVGKTSLGMSIARSMGRKFIRVSLGGIRDEADIRGHRRTYIGALPGRIMQELRKAGSNNPVFMLDELDKVGNDFRGDPASALLEVLDPQQNNSFTDHYFDQPFDLSKVMFIGTANCLDTVPAALRDRLEVLDLPGYTAEEKLLIAKRYLLPRQLIETGLSEKILKIKDKALDRLITSYTREAGVRELERQIAAICRAVAADVASGKCKSTTVSTDKHIAARLGPFKYESELALRSSLPGVATGLAYTPVGGEILFIEATRMPGKGQLILTGQLGDVMKESAQTALSVLKSIAFSSSKAKAGSVFQSLAEVVADQESFSKQDIHIHVPAGAIPKDGPSAGLAMYTAVASLLTGLPVRSDIAMTGEITLRGIALPIGGVKEKLLAAKRAGIKTVILPERNRKDLVDLPGDVRRQLKFEFVRNVDKVLQIALENGQ